MQEIYEEYHPQGLEILAFPCNQFFGQEPKGPKEIKKFAETKYGVTFPLFFKTIMNGKQANPFFKWLKEETKDSVPKHKRSPGWPELDDNFIKFLIDRSGQPVKRFPGDASPKQLLPEIRRLLAEKAPDSAEL